MGATETGLLVLMGHLGALAIPRPDARRPDVKLEPPERVPKPEPEPDLDLDLDPDPGVTLLSPRSSMFLSRRTP